MPGIYQFCLEPDLLKGYTVNIRAALWNKDGKFVFSGGEDKAMRFAHLKQNMTFVWKIF